MAARVVTVREWFRVLQITGQGYVRAVEPRSPIAPVGIVRFAFEVNQTSAVWICPEVVAGMMAEALHARSLGVDRDCEAWCGTS
jgi:hypothetical protein